MGLVAHSFFGGCYACVQLESSCGCPTSCMRTSWRGAWNCYMGRRWLPLIPSCATPPSVEDLLFGSKGPMAFAMPTIQQMLNLRTEAGAPAHELSPYGETGNSGRATCA